MLALPVSAASNNHRMPTCVQLVSANPSKPEKACCNLQSQDVDRLVHQPTKHYFLLQLQSLEGGHRVL